VHLLSQNRVSSEWEIGALCECNARDDEQHNWEMISRRESRPAPWGETSGLIKHFFPLVPPGICCLGAIFIARAADWLPIKRRKSIGRLGHSREAKMAQRHVKKRRLAPPRLTHSVVFWRVKCHRYFGMCIIWALRWWSSHWLIKKDCSWAVL
jgi:hypothetical protein